MLVIGRKAGSSGAHAFAIGVGAVMLAFGIVAVVVWRRSKRGRR
jgi:hypothetical protein